MQISTQATYQRTIGAASLPFPISVTADQPGTVQVLSTPPANVTQTASGASAIVAGQTIALSVNIGIPTDPGQLDTPGTLTIRFTPTGGTAQDTTVPVVYRATDYITSGPAAGTWAIRALAGSWICAHPGAAWGLIKVQNAPVQAAWGAAPPTSPLPGTTYQPGEEILQSATSPKLWVKGTSSWPGNFPQSQPGDLFQVYAPNVLCSR